MQLARLQIRDIILLQYPSFPSAETRLLAQNSFSECLRYVQYAIFDLVESYIKQFLNYLYIKIVEL